MSASERDLATEVERTPHQPAQHVTAVQLDTLRHGLRGAAAALVSWTELLAEGPTAERIDRASRGAALLSRRLDELDQLVRTQRAAESAPVESGALAVRARLRRAGINLGAAEDGSPCPLCGMLPLTSDDVS